VRIWYLGPEEREAMLQDWASPGVEIVARDRGDRSALESLYDEYMEVPAYLQAVLEAEQEGFDAIIIGCFGDPGIDAARELVSIPVVAIGEASLIVASMLGVRFGVLTPLEKLAAGTLRHVRALGLESRLAHVEPVEIPIMTIRTDPAATYRAMLRGARVCMDKGAHSLALACGSMSVYASELQEELGIPVVNGLRVGVRFAELLVGSNLSFSKRSWPFPTSLSSTGQEI